MRDDNISVLRRCFKQGSVNKFEGRSLNQFALKSLRHKQVSRTTEASLGGEATGGRKGVAAEITGHARTHASECQAQVRVGSKEKECDFKSGSRTTEASLGDEADHRGKPWWRSDRREEGGDS